MTNKEKTFCREYIIDFNATQAAIRAKYSKKTARVIAAQLLSKLIIQNEINRLMDGLSEKLDVKIEQIIYELKKIAAGDIKNVLNEDGEIDFTAIDDSVSPTISEFVTTTTETTNEKSDTTTVKTVRRVKMHDKLKALELLGRYRAMFTDKVERTGEPEKIIIMTPEEKAVIDKAKKK